MITLIASALGIVSTLVAWNCNPRRRYYAQLDKIYSELEKCYAERDKALADNDSVMLSIVTNRIIKLCEDKARIYKRWGKNI